MIYIVLFLLLFGVIPIWGEYIQYLAVILFIFIGFGEWLKSKRNFKINKDLIVIHICYLLPIFSLMALIFEENFKLIPQTLAFMFVAFSSAVIANKLPPKEFLKIILNAGIILTIVAILFNTAAIIKSLNFAVDDMGARLRFSPFSNHPNLTAHIFGIVMLASSIYIFWERRRKTMYWLALLATFICASLIVLATGSRGSIISLIMAYVFLFLSGKYNAKMINNKYQVITFFILIIFVFIYVGNNSLEYFIELLELNSQYRGIDTGMTGRTDNWPFIVGVALSNFQGYVIGHGIRSWNDTYYSMSTDSSYINSLWESGLILTLITIFLLLNKIHKLYRIKNNLVSDVYFSLLIYIAIESIVARYLIGIGNPGSIIILVILLTHPNKILHEYKRF